MTLGPAPYTRPGLEARFRHVALFIGDNVRKAVQDGRADFVPVFLSEVPRLLGSTRMRVDVALVQVSPPDASGCVSLGVSVDVVRAAIDAATLVIAEVNPRMPRTFGDAALHVDRIDALVPVDTPLPELVPAPLDEVSRAIGHNVAALVPDGATLQVGIGRIPDAVLSALADRRDLGVHSEMISDGVMRLALAGAINGRRKTLLPGKIVTSFVLGSRALYAWANENPDLELRASNFTNDPLVIAQNRHMIAINGALAVDLTGQVAADTIGGRFFSGIGGQVDFMRGAARSAGGKPIVALPSTAKGGAVSRIQGALEAGAGVVTSRGDVHYVVTEHGVADLWGKSVRERALTLVEIAHPDHRAELLAQAKARKYVFVDQPLPPVASAWPSARVATLETGQDVIVRRVLPSDEAGLRELLYGLSEDRARERFHAAHRLHPRAEVEPLVSDPTGRSVAFVCCCDDLLVGYARAVLSPDDAQAEVDFVVREGWRGRSIGRRLMHELVDAARARGVTRFEAVTMLHDAPMLHLLGEAGPAISDVLGDGIRHVVIDVSGARAPS